MSRKWYGTAPYSPATTHRRLDLRAPDVLPTLEDNGLAVIDGSPEQFAALIRDGIERYGAIIKAAGIQPE